MTDYISREAAIDAICCDITVTGRQNAELVAATIRAFADRIKALPSVQPEPLAVNFAREMDRETIERLKDEMKNAPVLIMAVNDSVQPDRKPAEWLHDLLQDAIDDGIITETQASRLMDRIAEDNT